jgi:methionine sulfoxide reductase heme-binding subunit
MTAQIEQRSVLRRLPNSTLARHLTAAVIATALVLGFSVVHAEWSPMHRWNRAFGDAAFALIALTMILGPLARFLRPVGRVLRLRREFGIHGCLLIFAHGAIVLVGWVEWDLMRLLGFEWHPDLNDYVMFQHGFGLANAIGLAALFLAAVLAATSSDFALRRLGVSGWKFLQMGVLPLWWLSVAHVAYFLFMHFLSFHRATPEPNPLQYWFVGIVLLVFVLRSGAYVQTVRTRSNPNSIGEAPHHAQI